LLHNHLFGPIQSRRLGTSLGVDLIPFKTCSMNCIYCECGATTALTLVRKDYVPTAEVIAELDDLLAARPHLDSITFSGAGEPTLAANIGAVIAHLKTHYPEYLVTVITNSSLLSQQAVRDDLACADIIIPSLNAVSENVFKQLNRPMATLSAETIIEGLIALRNETAGMIWLEIFIVPGLNDQEAELRKMKTAIDEIRPDKIQLNTLARPGTESTTPPATPEQLAQVAARLAPTPVEIYGGSETAGPNDPVPRFAPHPGCG